MTTPLEISFHGIEKSDAVEARIREKFARMEEHFERITHARVVVTSPNRAGQRARMFQVKIDIGVPGHQPVVINQEGQEPYPDVFIALRDAFSAATRKLDETSDRMKREARQESARRKPRPDTQD